MKDADLIIDGLKTREELTKEIINGFQIFLEKNEQK